MVLWWPFWKWRLVEIFRCRESIQDIEIEQGWICSVLWRPFWKWRPVEIFQCQESIRNIIIYPHMKCRWNWTMLSILKMATGRNFSMSGINSGHHNLSTHEMSLKLDNVEFVRYCGGQPVEICQCRESIRDIIIYPHIKFWWYRTILNFCHPFFMPCFGSHFQNGRYLENFENAELLL